MEGGKQILEDKKVNFQKLLSKNNFENEMLKAIANLRFIFPTFLQNRAIPLLNQIFCKSIHTSEESDSPNKLDEDEVDLSKIKNKLIIHYNEFNGIKCSVFIPLLNYILLKDKVWKGLEKSQSSEIERRFSVIICHSKLRGSSLKSTLKSLTTFTQNKIVYFHITQKNLHAIIQKWEKLKEQKNVILISTPQLIAFLLEKSLIKPNHINFMLFDQVNIN
jgi:hypothetical protein